MKVFLLIFIVLSISCSDKKNLEVFYNEGRTFSVFENNFRSGYSAPSEKIETLKKIIGENNLIKEDVGLPPDVSGYFHSFTDENRYKTDFYVFVLEYSELPTKAYEVISLYFDEEGKLIWRNCNTKKIVCSSKSAPSDRGWFYDI